jgi:hypothetical protein
MARFQFCSASYTLQSPISDAEELMNAYNEQPETTGATSAMTIMHAPGLKVAYTLPETAIPGEFTVNGRTFVAGADFYELLSNGTYTNWGTLNGPPLSPTQICCCQTHLLILSNGDLFIFILTPVTDSNGVYHPANSFLAVDMSQFNGPVLQIDFCDGYFFAAIQNSNTFQVSNLEDGTTWNGLFISTISYFPDNIISLKVDHREVWFFSAKKTIAYYNCGAGYPPFIPIQAAFLEDGCAATFGTVQANDTICWIEANDRGQGIVKMMGSYVGIRISNLAVEYRWRTYSTIADAVAYAYQADGHNFLVIRFPTANATWVYDFSTSLWHRRGFWNQATATYTAHRSTSHTFNFGKHLVGDWASGNIYEMSLDVYTDFGNPIRGLRRTPTIMQENKWIEFKEIELLPEVGLGPIPPLLDGNGQPRGPQLMLRWSNDGTKTWSNTYYLDCGQAGQYNHRVRKMQLGRARKRVFEVTWTDAIPWRIVDAYLQATSEGKPIYETGERLSEQFRKVT